MAESPLTLMTRALFPNGRSESRVVVAFAADNVIRLGAPIQLLDDNLNESHFQLGSKKRLTTGGL